ncbi:MAG: hypothetical protein JNL56_00870 [Alphaproteobacteria bacterium]|nr:hypothetical protein [Alphaproteobacteria bacterium]
MNHVRDLMRPADGGALQPRRPDHVQMPEPPDLWRPFVRGLWASFGALVVAPALAVLVYLLAFASPLYEAQSQFVVRGDVNRPGGGSLGGAVGAVAALNVNQESSILVRFLPSRALVERLRGTLDVAALYSSPDIDSLSRLAEDADADAVAAYWADKVSASVDPVSGVVTLKVRAYSPEDALTLNQAAMLESETMLNLLLDDSRRDALRVAEQDRERAAEALEDARRELEAFRREAGLLDPNDAGAQAVDLIYELRGQRAALSAQLEAALTSLSPSAPQVRALRTRLSALDDQIAALEAELVPTGGTEGLPVLISRFDALELKRAFAEKSFGRAELTLLRTQAEVERWHLYLTVFDPPTLAAEEVEPRPFWTSGKLFATLAVLWAILALLAAGTMDHRQ